MALMVIGARLGPGLLSGFVDSAISRNASVVFGFFLYLRFGSGSFLYSSLVLFLVLYGPRFRPWLWPEMQDMTVISEMVELFRNKSL